jgi:hypothetical protein
MSVTTEQSDPAGIEPLVVRLQAAKRLLGNCSNDEIYRKIKNGELESYLEDGSRRRLVVVASIKADIARKVAAAAAAGFQRARGADHDRLGRRPGKRAARRARRPANRKT